MKTINLIIQLFQDPLGMTILSSFFILLLTAIYFYISASLAMYKMNRIKILGIYNGQFYEGDLSFYDKFIIKQHAKKDRKYKDLFDRMYALELKKLEKKENEKSWKKTK